MPPGETTGIPSYSLLQRFRISPGVKYCHYNYFIGKYPIKGRKWKASNDGASQILMRNLEASRCFVDQRQCLVDALHELEVQVSALTCVPSARLGEFGFGVRSKADVH